MKQNKIKNLFLILTLLFLSGCSSDDIMSSAIKKAETFVFLLYEGLGGAFQDLFFTLAVIFIAVEIVRILLNKNGQLLNIAKMGLTISLVSSIAFSPEIFKEYLYNPIVYTIYNMSAFIINLSVGEVGNSFSDPRLIIKAMLDSLDATVLSVKNIADKMIEIHGGLLSVDGVGVALKFGALKILYFGLQAVFVVLFVVGIMAAHIFLALFPFALCFIAFKEMRGLSFNIFRAFSTYALMPFFISIAMGLTLNSLESLTGDANKYFEELTKNPNALAPSFVGEAFFIGILSWFFHIKASEFAAQTVGSQISNFGQNFASAVGAGVGVAKLPLSGTRLAREIAGHAKALGNTIKGGANMASSVASGVGQGLSGAYNMAKNSNFKTPNFSKKSANDTISKSFKNPSKSSNSTNSKALPYHGSKMNHTDDGWKIVGVMKQLGGSQKQISTNNNKLLN
jgi:hypothetical protein